MLKRTAFLFAALYALIALVTLLPGGDASAGLFDRFRSGGDKPAVAQKQSPAAVKAREVAEPEVARVAGPFTLVSLTERELDGSPALALTFSEPLDPKASYDGLIRVVKMAAKAEEGDDESDEDDGDDDENRAEPGEISETEEAPSGSPVQGGWVLGDNPRILYFPHISPQTNYGVIVDGKIAGKGTQPLGEDKKFTARTNAVSPTYHFASRGMVLPAKQNGGLPVVTVNVPEVDVQFLRVRDDRLAAFLDKVIASPPGTPREDREDEEDLRGAIGIWNLDNLRKFADSVYTTRFATEEKPNRRAVTFLPVEDVKELAEPGVYVAVMSQPGRFRYEYQVTYFYVSDLGLHARLFEKNADIYLSSLTTGQAVPNATVRWLDAAGKELAKATSDAEGRAHFDRQPEGAKVIQAQLGKQVAMIALKEPALDLSEYQIKGEPGKPVRLFAWAGRDLYRPGEIFNISVLARDADGRAVQALPIQAVLKRPDGKKQSTAFWQPENAASGYYHETVAVPLDAPTGFWRLELRADPADKIPAAVFRFGVEEFLPERMKLDLSAQSQGLSAEGSLVVGAKGAYLYGAPAANNRLLGVVQFRRNPNPLKETLPGFVFGDVGEDSFYERRELAEQNLDARGQGAVQINLEPAQGRHSPILVQTTISLLESGGRPVVRSIERTLWPADALIGVRPLFTGDYAKEGAPVEFEVARADQSGRLLAAAELPVRLFRENRHWYWRYDDNRGWHSGFTETDELAATTRISITEGQRGRLTLPVRYGRYRLEITDPDSNETLKYRFYAGWSAKALEAEGVRPDKVTLKLDKPAYREGRDTAQVTITPPHGGQALITVESDRTLWVKRMAMPESGATVAIPIDQSWTSHDLYVNVLVLRPGSEGDHVTPTRALGLAPLPLEREERGLKLTLEAPDKMRPEQDMEVKVRVPDAAGQQAMLTLSAVDVGILNITNFASPDPFAYFFGQLRYGADLRDIYGRLIEKMAGKKGRLRFGGDAAPKTTKGLPKKVRLVDIFSGPVALDDKGEATVKLPVPDFNGTLRLMAVAATAERFGSAEREVLVAAPLVAELSTPRFISNGDEAAVALDLHNLSGGPAELAVSLPPVEGLMVHNPERKISLKDQEKAIVKFTLQADREFLGLADLRVKVAGETGEGPLDLDRSFALEVKPLTPEGQTRRFYEIPAGGAIELRDAGLGGFMPASLLAHVSLSDAPPLDLRGAIQGLLTYPYGCVEQTTSSTYPHLFIDEDTAKKLGLKPFSLEQRHKMVAESMGKLAAYQAANGGFSLWGGSAEYWLSAYVANFLQDAADQGFEAPADMRARVMDYLLKALQAGIGGVDGKPAKAESNTWWRDEYVGKGRFGVLAYGAYVLARESRAPLSTLRLLHEKRGSATSGLSLVQLGLALHLMGDQERGRAAIAEGIAKPRLAGWWGDYGSDLRDAALAYALLNKHGLRPEGMGNLLLAAANAAKGQAWLSTQEKMAVFLAASGVLEPKAAEKTPWRATLHKGGAAPERLTAEGGMILPLSADELAEGLRLENTSNRPLYAELALSGRPRNMPPAGGDIRLERHIYTADGEPFEGDHFVSGASYIVELRAAAPMMIANAMIVDHVPAGFEIENLNLVQGEGLNALEIDGRDVASVMADSDIQHQEFREDRFVAAAKIDATSNWKYPDTRRLYYRVRVVTPGRYTRPPLYAEDMYRPAVRGLVPGGETITVTEGGMR